jgi:Tfp pilus assembly protein PilF
MAVAAFENAFKVGFVKYEVTEIRISLGYSYLEVGEYDRAIEKFKKALSLDQNYYKALVGLGIVYRQMDDYAKATDTYNRLHRTQNSWRENWVVFCQVWVALAV